MFYQIQRIKAALQTYLRERKKTLRRESTEFETIEEAYRAGFLRGYWEGAGTAVQENKNKSRAIA